MTLASGPVERGPTRSVDLHGAVAQIHDTVGVACRLRVRAEAAIRDSQRAVSRSEATRLLLDGVRPRRPEQTGGVLRGFSLRGRLDGADVQASWTRDRLVASPALVGRGLLLVDMGETFGTSTGPTFGATLTGPVDAVLLTLVRACDRVIDVTVHRRTI